MGGTEAAGARSSRAYSFSDEGGSTNWLEAMNCGTFCAFAQECVSSISWREATVLADSSAWNFISSSCLCACIAENIRRVLAMTLMLSHANLGRCEALLRQG